MATSHDLLHPVQVELAEGTIGNHQFSPVLLGRVQDGKTHLRCYLDRLDGQIGSAALALVGIVHRLSPQGDHQIIQGAGVLWVFFVGHLIRGAENHAAVEGSDPQSRKRFLDRLFDLVESDVIAQYLQ